MVDNTACSDPGPDRSTAIPDCRDAIGLVDSILGADDAHLRDLGNGWAIVATLQHAWVWVTNADRPILIDPDEALGWSVGIYQGTVRDRDFRTSVYLTAEGPDLSTLGDLLLEAHEQFTALTRSQQPCASTDSTGHGPRIARALLGRGWRSRPR